jgi:hypothetical protein
VNSDEVALAVIDALDELQIPYMVVGSLSSNYYGIPRATHDADFVVQVEPGTIAAIVHRLGPPFALDRQITFETVTAPTRYIVRIADDPFTAELFLLSEDLHDQERFARRRRERILDRDADLPTAEDVIVTKLRWSHSGRRSKDIDDVENVIAVQGDCIDWAYVTSWCDRHGTRELLDRVRQAHPPE